MAVRIVEEGHPQVVVIHLGDEVRPMGEYNSAPFQFGYGQRHVRAAEVVDPTLSGRRSIVCLLKHEPHARAIEESQVTEPVQFSQPDYALVKFFSAFDIADRQGDLSDVAQIQLHGRKALLPRRNNPH